VHRRWPFAAARRPSRPPIKAAGPALGFALVMLLIGPPAVAAHTVQRAGSYTLEIGWQHEPTYVGESNGVQIIVSRGPNKPITDLKADDLSVVVTTGGTDSDALTFEPGFDLEEGDGTPGEYNAAIMPTAPGDYSFHVTGSIHGQKVDIKVSSGDTTFDTVKGTSDIEFPVKLPTLTELTTKVDQIGRRVDQLGNSLAAFQSGSSGGDAARAEAADARSMANPALLVGGGLGIIGIVLGVIGIWLAARARRARPG